MVNNNIYRYSSTDASFLCATFRHIIKNMMCYEQLFALNENLSNLTKKMHIQVIGY